MSKSIDRYKQVKKASVLGIIGNFFLFIIKGIIAIFTHSEAMIGDAINSLSDILSSFMGFLGNHIASRPCDEDHNLGHGKAEYIYSLFISFMMFILSINIAYSSIKSFFNHQEFIFSYYLIYVCLITIIIKLCLYIYNRKLAKKMANIILEASYKDHRNDMIITTFNLISVIFSLKGIYIFDSIVGLGIAIWIFSQAISIFKKSYDVLMDKSFSVETKNKVLDIIKNYPEVKDINHFNATPVGYKYQISFTIFVNGRLSTFDSHAIANNLEKEIVKKIPEVYLAIIHVNPLDLS